MMYTIQCLVWAALVMLPLVAYFVLARGFSVIKSIGIAAALLLGALAVSISDVKAEGCEQLFEIVEIDIDPDQNTLYRIRVSEWTRENGSDSVCQWFGRCVLDLISAAPGMGAVEILNPEDEWVPSARRWIEVNYAMILAGAADLEEQAWLSSYAYGYDD